MPSDAVGAIIGKQGATVKQIKQTAHAKVDVNKNEATNSQERMIVIHGQQENCIQACREILRIMYEDAKNKNKSKCDEWRKQSRSNVWFCFIAVKLF